GRGGSRYGNKTDERVSSSNMSVYRRCIEVCVLSSIMSIIMYVMPLMWNKCTPLPVNMEGELIFIHQHYIPCYITRTYTYTHIRIHKHILITTLGWSDEEKSLVEDLIPLYCNAETQYNELASLYLTDSDTAIRQLFHFREVGTHSDIYTFSSACLVVYWLPYMIMACLVCNTAVPAGKLCMHTHTHSHTHHIPIQYTYTYTYTYTFTFTFTYPYPYTGLFVPSLLSGATFGRLVGHLLHQVDNTKGTFADSGTYALMGAAALTAGMVYDVWCAVCDTWCSSYGHEVRLLILIILSTIYAC
ncbi:hypothetical protein EON63_17405, partial [archaeon]